MVESEFGLAVGNYGTVLKSEDGGSSWTALSRFTDFELDKIAVLDKLHAVVAGRLVRIAPDRSLNTKIRFFKTSDGGKSWETVLEPDGNGIFFAEALDDGSVVIGIDGEKTLLSNDSGATWSSISQNMVDVNGAENGITWGISQSGTVFTSDDFGRTWGEAEEFQQDISISRWSAIDFSDFGHSAAVAQTGRIAVSTDRGVTWKRLPEFAPESLTSVVVGNGCGFAQGTSGAFYGFSFGE